MKKLIKICIMFVLVLSFFAFNSSATEAISKKTAFVNTKDDPLTVRSGAGTKYKKVGSLKKYAKITVYSTTKNGWSEIKYKKKTAYVSSKYLININIKNSRVTYSLQDVNGKKYTVYVIGTNEKKAKGGTLDVNTDWAYMWAGIDIGDTLYKGDYKIYLCKNGSQTASYTGYQYKDHIYNATQKMMYSIPSKYKGQPTLFIVSEVITSSDDEADVYYIYKGKLKKLRKNNGYFGYTYRPQIVGKNIYKIASSNNVTGKWYVDTLKFNLNKGSFTLINTKQYDYNKMYKWRKDWE